MTTPKNYSPQMEEILRNLYYRQSMIKDYLTCPSMMLYRWIVGHEESDTFFAAIMGTAGHEVIRMIHETDCFDYSYMDLLTIFYEKFDAAVEASPVPPKIGIKFSTLTAQRDAVAPEYVEMLQGYQKDKENQRFHASVIEQSFALTLTDEFGRDFIFTGTADQAGFYDNGQFSLRDIKFRANNFKPKKTQLALDIQLSLYAYAIKYGNPTCSECKPTYDVAGNLVYNGPCPACQKMIDTNKWPNMIPERCELIWMRDYTKRKKDEHAQYITSDTEKELNPETGRYRKKRELNPAWVDGYKKGDNCGPGILRTDRTQAFLEVHVGDILRVAGMIRDGRFYRKSGDHCEFWCKFKEACLSMLETQVEEKDLEQIRDNVSSGNIFED